MTIPIFYADRSTVGRVNEDPYMPQKTYSDKSFTIRDRLIPGDFITIQILDATFDTPFDAVYMEATAQVQNFRGAADAYFDREAIKQFALDVTEFRQNWNMLSDEHIIRLNSIMSYELTFSFRKVTSNRVVGDNLTGHFILVEVKLGRFVFKQKTTQIELKFYLEVNEDVFDPIIEAIQDFL